MPAAASTSDPRTLLSLALLVLGTALAYWALDRPRWDVPVAVLAAVGVTAWTLTNTPYEGAILAEPFRGNGVTAADLLSLPAALLVVRACLRSVRR